MARFSIPVREIKPCVWIMDRRMDLTIVGDRQIVAATPSGPVLDWGEILTSVMEEGRP